MIAAVRGNITNLRQFRRLSTGNQIARRHRNLGYSFVKKSPLSAGSPQRGRPRDGSKPGQIHCDQYRLGQQRYTFSIAVRKTATTRNERRTCRCCGARVDADADCGGVGGTPGPFNAPLASPPRLR